MGLEKRERHAFLIVKVSQARGSTALLRQEGTLLVHLPVPRGDPVSVAPLPPRGRVVLRSAPQARENCCKRSCLSNGSPTSFAHTLVVPRPCALRRTKPPSDMDRRRDQKNEIAGNNVGPHESNGNVAAALAGYRWNEQIRAVRLANFREAGRSTGQIFRSLPFAVLTVSGYGMDALFHSGHSEKFGRILAIQPQAPSFRSVEEFLGARRSVADTSRRRVAAAGGHRGQTR